MCANTRCAGEGACVHGHTHVCLRIGISLRAFVQANGGAQAHTCTWIGKHVHARTHMFIENNIKTQWQCTGAARHEHTVQCAVTSAVHQTGSHNMVHTVEHTAHMARACVVRRRRRRGLARGFKHAPYVSAQRVSVRKPKTGCVFSVLVVDNWLCCFRSWSCLSQAWLRVRPHVRARSAHRRCRHARGRRRLRAPHLNATYFAHRARTVCTPYAHRMRAIRLPYACRTRAARVPSVCRTRAVRRQTRVRAHCMRTCACGRGPAHTCKHRTCTACAHVRPSTPVHHACD